MDIEGRWKVCVCGGGGGDWSKGMSVSSRVGLRLYFSSEPSEIQSEVQRVTEIFSLK